MKKIHLLMTVVVLSLLTSCLKDQEDIFDKTSSMRAEEAIAADYKILASAEHGWLMKYYPSPYQTYGGYNVFLKFTEDGKVTVASDIVASNKTAESFYKVTQSAGVVLSFDTYNEIFHLFSDPSAPLRLGETGKGMEGDYDFEFISASEQKIVLKGKKTGNYATLTPMRSDNWAAYIDSVKVVEENMNFPHYTMKVDTTDVVIFKTYRNLELYYLVDSTETVVNVPFVVTPEGMEFYEPVTINGQQISGFKYAEDTFDFASIDNANIMLNGIVPPINETFVGDLWATSLSNIGEFGKPYWENVRDNIMPLLGETLNYFYFGKNDSYWGVTFNSGGYGGVIGFQYQLVGEDEIKLVYYANGNYSNGDWYMSPQKDTNGLVPLYGLIVPLGCSPDVDAKGLVVPVVRTFKLTCDNAKSPSWVLLTDVDNPNNVIRFVNQSLDPFND